MSVLYKLKTNKTQDELCILSNYLREEIDKINQGLIGLSIAQNTLQTRINILEQNISLCQLKIRDALKYDESEAKKWLKKKLIYEEILQAYWALTPEINLSINKIHNEIKKINQLDSTTLADRDLAKLRKIVS